VALVAIPILTAVAGALVWHPFVVLIAVPIVLGWLGGLAFGPIVFLCFVAATAGFSFSFVEGLQVGFGGRVVNPNGLHWGVTFIVASLLLMWFRAGPLPRLFRPYAALVLLAAVGLAWAPDWFDGLKQMLLYCLTLLLGWLTYRTVRTREAIHWVSAAWWVGLAFSATVALVMAAAELPARPPLGGMLGNRSFGMHLLPFFAMALAGVRERQPGRGLLAAAICLLALLSLSRMVLAAMLALGLVAFLVGRGPRRLLGVLGVAALGYAALQFEPLRDRIFLYAGTGLTGFRWEIVGQGSDAQLTVGNINLSGRGLVWVQTWVHGMEAPLFGHGTGAATVFLERDLGLAISHPHNDYLRILHDFGVIGFALLLYTGGFVLSSLWRMYQGARSSWSRQWTGSAALAWLAYLLMALTDNSMIYATYFAGGVFMLMGVALRALEIEAVERSEALRASRQDDGPLGAATPAGSSA
jgi:hypothetical protein